MAVDEQKIDLSQKVRRIIARAVANITGLPSCATFIELEGEVCLSIVITSPLCGSTSTIYRFASAVERKFQFVLDIALALEGLEGDEASKRNFAEKYAERFCQSLIKTYTSQNVYLLETVFELTELSEIAATRKNDSDLVDKNSQKKFDNFLSRHKRRVMNDVEGLFERKSDKFLISFFYYEIALPLCKKIKEDYEKQINAAALAQKYKSYFIPLNLIETLIGGAADISAPHYIAKVFAAYLCGFEESEDKIKSFEAFVTESKNWRKTHGEKVFKERLDDYANVNLAVVELNYNFARTSGFSVVKTNSPFESAILLFLLQPNDDNPIMEKVKNFLES